MVEEQKEEVLKFEDKVVKSRDVEGLKAQYELHIDSMQANVEPHYYWILDFLKKPGHFGLGMYGNDGKVIKLKDIYTAGVSSAYWGATEQKKTVQQEKAMNMLASIGKMVKDTFQIVREVRIIKERLVFYNDSNKGDLSADIALKGTWIDMVEGGAKNPGSVYGLSAQVGFATLPDLFFRIFPKKSESIDAETAKAKKNLGLNPKIIEVLRRKLKQYIVWKEKTYQELKTRETFILKYLRQHYNTIKLYMNWLRPYLRNVKELQMKGDSTDAALAKAFDTSKIELELIGVKNFYTKTTSEGYKISEELEKYKPGVWVSIKFTAVPMMAYQQEYQRGAIHAGKTEILIRGVVVTDDEIKKYQEDQEKEDLEIISSVFESMEALGEEFRGYLKEAGEKVEEKEEEKKEETSLTPFGDIIKGFKEVFGAFRIKRKVEKEGEIIVSLSKAKEKVEKKEAEAEARQLAFRVYDIFKKSHGMLAW